MRPGDKLLNYTVTRRMKAGGMGVVFEGEQTWGSRRKVAIKQLLENLRDDETIRRRFIREAEILEMLEDPRIVRILGFDPDQDAFVMEFVEGKTLSDYLKENPAIFRQPGILAAFMADLLDAFAYAHNAVLTVEGRTEKGIVHRDIKPSNIIVQPNGTPKILDFGISRIASFQSTLTDPKLQMGSVPYMSPEQIVTPTDVDWRSDIYSLGVTVWEMLAGRSPYPRVTTHEVVIEVQRQIRFDPLPLLAHIVPAETSNDKLFLRRIDQIIAKATAKERSHRYQHCTEMKLAVQHAFNEWLNQHTDKSPIANDLTGVTQLKAPQESAGKRILTTEQILIEKNDELLQESVHKQTTSPTPDLESKQPITSKKVSRHWVLYAGIATLLLISGFIWLQQRQPSTSTETDTSTTLIKPAMATEVTLEDLARADSCLELANNYYYGQAGVANNFKQALHWYEKAAQLGNSDAQNRLGSMYQYGKGISQNYAQALTWYRLSAEQGNADGQKNLGVMYYLGLGMDKNYTEALKWFQASAEQGNTEGSTNLGVMYEHGAGTAVDNAKALKWYMRAANQQYPRAQYYVGTMYALGKGIEQSSAKAVQWYQLAARQGDSSAQQELHRLQKSW